MASLLQSASLLYRRNGKSQTNTAALAVRHGLLSTELFAQALYRERKRTERSGRGFVLMTLESPKLLDVRYGGEELTKVLGVLAQSTRDTDIKGWRKQGTTIGVIFTELGPSADAAISALRSKVTGALESALKADQVRQIELTLRAYPENWEQAGGKDPQFYDDLFQEDKAADPLPRLLKRAMDIAGSLLALICGMPLLLAIAAAVKLTSKGPVLFRQKRMGQYGKKFDFLKFRSMHVNNDESIHREFVKTFISNPDGCQMQFKLAGDPRITRVGNFLRKTSLDELPQFINVLKGEMSLVGPRPPIPYELESYDIWHRTRLLAAKPGITGLWQVSGRSRVKFDDMVRMDLRYAKSWSLWLDLKILLQTPHAVLSGNGAR